MQNRIAAPRRRLNPDRASRLRPRAQSVESAAFDGPFRLA
jgi:hypothetical protein